MLGILLAVSACRFPAPTRAESSSSNNNSSSSKKESFTEESVDSSKPAKKEVSTSTKPHDLLNQIQELRADLQSTNEDWDQKQRTLNDKVDILQHDYEQEMKKIQKAHQDMDQRLIELEKRNNAAPNITPSPAQSSAKPTESNDIVAIVPEKNVGSTSEQKYQTILDSFLEQKNYDKSIKEFKKFIQENPKDGLAGNAQYWIGEGYYSKSDWPKAITEFQKVPDQYPNSSKKCDALLKQSMAFTNMKDASNAKLFLQETQSQCPGSPAADKAKKLLKDLK